MKVIDAIRCLWLVMNPTVDKPPQRKTSTSGISCLLTVSEAGSPFTLIQQSAILIRAQTKDHGVRAIKRRPSSRAEV